jgi:uncharacterized UBP type Zn finger protein
MNRAKHTQAKKSVQWNFFEIRGHESTFVTSTEGKGNTSGGYAVAVDASGNNIEACYLTSYCQGLLNYAISIGHASN